MIQNKLDEYGVDYLLVNSTNKYLLEYVPDEENQCNQITGFTGDVGDALVASNGPIWLFVDSRFHIQADLEVDKSKVEVVKLQLGQKANEEICLRIKPNSILGINPETVSQQRYENLKTFLDVIGVEIKFITQQTTCRTGQFVELPEELTGKSSEEKIIKLNNTLITKSEEISYLTNTRCFSFNYSTKIDGKLLIINNKATLYSDYKGEYSGTIKPLSAFEQDIAQIDIPLFVDKTSINARDYALVKHPVHKKSVVSEMKSIKNDTEINHLKYCFEMTDKALRATRDWFLNTKNLTEHDVANRLEENFYKYGAKSLSFKSIVALNQNSALAHYNKSDKTTQIKDGDLLLIDCGAYYDGGLATDITRVFVKGNPSDLQKQVYTTVLKTFLNCFAYSPITNGFEIDNLAREIIDNNTIDGFTFSHGLGHGVGIGVHESPPNLSKHEIAKTELKNNMCFTIEPGLYNEKHFGVRLENTCYIQDNKIKSFTNMCFEEKLIDYALLNSKEKEILKQFEVV